MLREARHQSSCCRGKGLYSVKADTTLLTLIPQSSLLDDLQRFGLFSNPVIIKAYLEDTLPRLSDKVMLICELRLNVVNLLGYSRASFGRAFRLDDK